MTEKRFDIDARGNARVNAIGELHAERVDFGDRYPVQQRVSVIGLDPIPPEHRADQWIDRLEPQQALLQRIEAQAKLIELLAVGGFGKSLLATWLFHTVKGKFERSLWLNFRKVPTFNEFSRWVLQEIGYLIDDPRVEDEALVRELTYRLTEKRCLLVLDQLEAFQNANDRGSFEIFLQTWQQRGRMSVVIVTTRLPFEIEGRDRIDLTGLTESEGAAFLRKQGIQTSDEQPLRELVRMAEGHPLLLNLAASWLRQEAQGEINAAGLGFFEQLFRRVQGNAEAKVEEIFAQLFAELPERLRSLLLGVVVYRNPFGLEMAQAMLADASIEDLRSLVERAFLLEATERWTLHPLIKNLVEQALKSSDRHREAHQKAIAYFTAKIKPEKETIADCTEELEIFHHHCELGEYALADQIMNTCVNFLDRRGYYRDLLPIYGRLTHHWTLENPHDAEEQRNLGWAWTRLGNLYQAVGQSQSAINAHQQAQTLFHKIDYSKGEAASLTNLGTAYHALGQYPQAIDFLQQALDIQREISDRRGEANALNNLGNIYYSLGEYPRAIDFYQQSLDIQRKIGDRRGEANALNNLGNIYYSLGEYPRAIDFYQQSLDIQRKIGDRRGEANALNNLGNIYYSLGQYPRAINFYQQALEITREIGDRRGEANSLIGLGNAYDSLGEYPRAINFYQQALEITREIGDRNGEANSLTNLGTAYHALGEYPQAIDFLQQALDIQREIGDRLGEGNSLFNKAQALAKYEPRRFEALTTLQQARAIFMDLSLDHMVEKCDEAIHDFNQIIATEERQSAPSLPIAPTVGNAPTQDDWWERSLPTQSTARSTSQRQINWILWFCVGIAIVLLIAWLRK